MITGSRRSTQMQQATAIGIRRGSQCFFFLFFLASHLASQCSYEEADATIRLSICLPVILCKFDSKILSGGGFAKVRSFRQQHQPANHSANDEPLHCDCSGTALAPHCEAHGGCRETAVRGSSGAEGARVAAAEGRVDAAHSSVSLPSPPAAPLECGGSAAGESDWRTTRMTVNERSSVTL